MKRAILPTLCLALLLALPARTQGEPKPDLPSRVEQLEQVVERQARQIDALEQYVTLLKNESARLGDAPRVAEKGGFLLPTPANDAKKALLHGIGRFAASAATGKPAPAPAEGEESDDEDR
jgi:hypothetical protein